MSVPSPKEVAVALFYDAKGNILLQDRRQRSKWGEEYGFFGGKVEEGETAEQAIAREIHEELGLSNINFTLFKKYTHKGKESGVKVDRNIYLADLPDVSKLVCNEGKIAVRTFLNSLDLKMITGFNELLQEIYSYLKSKGKTV